MTSQNGISLILILKKIVCYKNKNYKKMAIKGQKSIRTFGREKYLKFILIFNIIVTITKSLAE